MSFSRWWTEATAALSDHVPLPLIALLLVLATGLVSAAWYTYPAWVPHRVPRPRRHSPTIRPARTAGTPVRRPPQSTEPPVRHLTLAEQLAGERRYAEAIRERLRGMVHELSEHDVVRVRPGMTVTEIVEAATARRPSAGPHLTAAATIFTQVWYGQRPATAEQDHRLHDHAVALRRLLTEPVEPTTTGSPPVLPGTDPPPVRPVRWTSAIPPDWLGCPARPRASWWVPATRSATAESASGTTNSSPPVYSPPPGGCSGSTSTDQRPHRPHRSHCRWRFRPPRRCSVGPGSISGRRPTAAPPTCCGPPRRPGWHADCTCQGRHRRRGEKVRPLRRWWSASSGLGEAAVRGFGPWLAVLAVVLLLSALRLRTLAALVSLGWLIWCVWTWVRPSRSR